jgi:hypothetical protein
LRRTIIHCHFSWGFIFEPTGIIADGGIGQYPVNAGDSFPRFSYGEILKKLKKIAFSVLK